MNEGRIHNPNKFTSAGLAVAAAILALGGSACSNSGEEDSSYIPKEPVATAESSTPATGTNPESATTTTELVNDVEGMDSDVVKELLASGLSEAQIKQIAETANSIPAQADIACTEIVAVAKGGKENAVAQGWLIDTGNGANDGLIVNFPRFVATRSLIQNGGELVSSDAVNRARTEFTPKSILEVGKYYGNSNNVDALTREAVDETFAGYCGNEHELAGSEIAFANLTIRGTDLRLGDIYKGALGDFVIDGEVTEESLNAKLKEVLKRYEVREGATEDEKLKAYTRQVEDAAMLISVARTLKPTINTETVHVDMSTQMFGTDEDNYPLLQFNNDPADATGKPNGLGGAYNAITGTGLTWDMILKADSDECDEIVLTQEKVLTNLAEGRVGYVVLKRASEGCEPVPSTPGTRPELSVPVDSIVIAGPGAGGTPDTDNNPDNNVTTSQKPAPSSSTSSTQVAGGDGNDNGSVYIP